MAYNETSWVTSGTTAAVTSKGATLYATFNIQNTESAGFSSGYHEALTFSNSNYASATANPNFGNGADPATTFTVSGSSEVRASDLVPCLWYVPDNITIDAVNNLEGADTSSSEATRMHLMSYTYTSGTASVLTAGTLLAHSADITNAGHDKTYSGTWTVDSGSVSAGKVIIATFESDAIASDYSIAVVVKYHLS